MSRYDSWCITSEITSLTTPSQPCNVMHIASLNKYFETFDMLTYGLFL